MTEPTVLHAQLERFATRLDWNLLRTYIFIVQERSITRAAERLCLQQPTVSAALKRLEEAMECRLIDRRPGCFELTEAGRKLYEEAMSIYRTVSRLHEFMDNSEADTVGHIRIMTISSVVSEVLDRQLELFFRDYPRVTVSFAVGSTAEVINAVENCTVTLGLSDGNVPAQLSSRLLCREQYAMYCGRAHPLYQRDDLTVEELRGEAYISFTSDVLGGEHMGPVTAMRAHASIGQYVRGSSCNVEEVCRMIINGVGIGPLPCHIARPLIEQGLLWQLPPYQNLPETEVHLLYNPQARFNDGEQALLDRLFKG